MDPAILFTKIKEYLPPDKVSIVEAAYEYARQAHEGQKRKSGAPFLEHPLQTAITLASFQLDAATLAAALLHDVPEDCNTPISEIEKKFGKEVSQLVDGVTKLSKVTWRRDVGVSSQESQAENLRKMLIAMAEDLRVVFIKLADRLHNMNTLDALPPERRHAIAQETMEIYAPLAHRLGMGQLKWQLEDLAFHNLEPEKYHEVARLISVTRTQREGFVDGAVNTLRDEMAIVGIDGEVSGRPKHIYSVSQKIKKYATLGRSFGDIHDLFALRVLVHDVSDCYKVLGIIHNLWHPITDEFNDYIANPKDNGYQSLHTTVLTQGATPLEIQIRTYDMHRMSEYGVAAHWRYKEGAKPDLHFEQKISWLRQLIDWQSSLDSQEFLASLKDDFFSDQVFVYTPRGEIKAFPKGATPLDFAYRIHTNLGHRCIGAKVNNRLVPLNYEMKNSNIIEIMVSKAEKAPSLDWLNSDLGFVKTAHAREKIRAWYKKQERTQNIDRGRTILEKELKRLGVDVTNFEELAKEMQFDNVDDFLAAAGYGGITPHQIASKLAGEPEDIIDEVTKPATAPTQHKGSGIQVLGVGDLLTHLAQCCHPVPGDDIIGYITRTHGITVHRKDCVNVINEEEKERLIEVSWGDVEDVYPINILVEAYDRVGLLRDITTVVAEEKINITSVSTQYNDDVFTMFATIEIKNMGQLNHLLSRIMSLRGVISARKKQYDRLNVSS
ncbi:MAG: bifunctional (p)ppGpp synthetase/guanosine-3',5'-bis(diphosphate) 3'-pyrophosphohydrolase [Dehalococcoidia bacterium]|nr:bifunctional (p)ppGpp synthetase/guanosine-3',5'-bis(diphosphate) 3'-pyrophosphohydrolase [Dehalococcoidia bacterium]